MNNKYLYEIRPITPIKDLIPGRVIYKSCSMQLTIDEVKKCMTYGPVYRKFPGETPIRVTGENLDIMHQKVFSEKNTKHIISYKDLDAIEKIKIILDCITNEWYFADVASGQKNDYFTDKYKDSTQLVNSTVAYISGFKKEIPIETIHSNKNNQSPPVESIENTDTSDTNNDNKDFLSEKEEEFSARTYNKNVTYNSSSKNNRHKSNKK